MIDDAFDDAYDDAVDSCYDAVDACDDCDDVEDAYDNAEDAYDDGEEGRFCVSARGADIQDMPCTGIRVRTQLHFILCQIFRYIQILSDFSDIFLHNPIQPDRDFKKHCTMCKILPKGKRTFA